MKSTTFSDCIRGGSFIVDSKDNDDDNDGDDDDNECFSLASCLCLKCFQDVKLHGYAI
jgi:hypothetical protein